MAKDTMVLINQLQLIYVDFFIRAHGILTPEALEPHVINLRVLCFRNRLPRHGAMPDRLGSRDENLAPI